MRESLCVEWWRYCFPHRNTVFGRIWRVSLWGAHVQGVDFLQSFWEGRGVVVVPGIINQKSTRSRTRRRIEAETDPLGYGNTLLQLHQGKRLSDCSFAVLSSCYFSWSWWSFSVVSYWYSAFCSPNNSENPSQRGGSCSYLLGTCRLCTSTTSPQCRGAVSA